MIDLLDISLSSPTRSPYYSHCLLVFSLFIFVIFFVLLHVWILIVVYIAFCFFPYSDYWSILGYVISHS